MFEQSIFESEPVNEPTPELQEGDLFQNYELRSWVPSPRLYKILGVSALTNILALLVFSQTSLLTAKGCDSPLVGSVCQVLDTVYIGSLLLGTKREYADAAYERTELADADITYIELPPEGSKLSYPEGYFQIANPEMFAAQQDPTNGGMPGDIPGFPNIPTMRPNPANSLLNTTPNYAKPKKDVVDGELPTGFDDPKVGENKPGLNKRRPGSNTPTNLPALKPGEIAPGIPGNANTPVTVDPNNPTVANNDTKDEAAPDRFGVYINRRPTKDFAAEALQKLEDKQIILDSPFKVTIKGTLGLAKDGKTVILKNAKPVLDPKETAGDPAMLKFAQEAILAFADAGWFGYLDKLESKNVTISLEQNDTAVIAKLTADQPDENKARSVASALNLLLAGASNGADGDAAIFLKAAKPGSAGKTFFVDFQLDKPVFTEMIQRKLAEEKAAPKQSTQPNGTAVVKPTSNVGMK